MRRLVCVLTVLAGLSATASFALNLTVDAVSGTVGSNPTNSIVDAIAQINAGADVDNNVTLDESAVHIIPATTVSTIGAAKNVYFASEPGDNYAIIRLSSGGVTNWTITQDAAQGTSITFTNIGFIPQTGQAYGNNSNDGIKVNNGLMIFSDCVFTFNNGSNGLGSVDGSSTYTTTNNVGDDWIQSTNCGLIFHGCTLTGCNDDAILSSGAGRTSPIPLLLDEGTFVGNIGGAAIQVYGAKVACTLDGADGRVLIAKCGMRPAATDTGVKFFWDAGCSFTMIKSDIIGCTNAAFYDFEGVPDISITDSRIALSNSGTAVPGANFIISDLSDDSAYTQNISITRSTFHDCLGADPEGAGIRSYVDNAGDPGQAYTITESIFSGAGDTFPMLGNAPSSVTKTNCAVVLSGPDAVTSYTALGTVGTVDTDDPAYLSYSYVTGRGQSNPEFLLPSTATSYKTAAPGGTFLKGGAPGIDNPVVIHKEIAALQTSLRVTPAGDDLINGIVGTKISGGFHPANTNPADQAPAFTDGAGLAGLSGLLNDFPGNGVPAWSGFWPLVGPTDIAEIRVFSGNLGHDGRIYHNVDAYVTFDATPTSVSLWQPLIKTIKPANFGDDNTASNEACLTVVQNPAGSEIAYGVTAIRFDFFAVSNTAKRFQDQWDAGNPNDVDGFSAAFESPLMYEVDVYGTKHFFPPSSVPDWSLF